MIHRVYDSEKDSSDCHRIWREVGWISSKGEEEAMDVFMSGGRVLLGDVSGSAEALVLSTPGRVRYLSRDLDLCAVCAVTTGYAGRKRGLAGKLTAELVALDAAEGAHLAGLGIFDQGYYDRLGFGTGPYEISVTLDPASLKLNIVPPPPVRLSKDDWELVHESRLQRMLRHGNTTLLRPEVTKSEMMWSRNGFGLGFMDTDGKELTHHFWCSSARGEHGPYSIAWMSYGNYCQYLELLALIKSLGDQVHAVRMLEPSGIQLQDLVRTPFRNARMTKRSEFQCGIRAVAFWQLRICDLKACLKRTSLQGEAVSFNLHLTDPISEYLEDDAPWKGIGGEYTVTLGPSSRAEKGHSSSLPTLEASVGAFTRMWIGAVPASGLCVTDDLAGPEELIRDLDRILSIPQPRIDWEY